MQQPYQAEYAKSGRASCKKCKDTIGKDSLRLAIMVQSPHFDGKVPNWYHFTCFWTRAKVSDQNDIHGFESLRWEDQQKIKKKFSAGSDGGADDMQDFSTEYAASGGAKCRVCEDKIKKGSVRIGKKCYDDQRAMMYGAYDKWFHVDCFVSDRDELGFPKHMQTEQIKYYKRLKQEDREMLLKKLGKGTAKRKLSSNGESSGEPSVKKDKVEEKALADQSKLLWKFRDALEKDVSKDAMKLLLELNGQDVPSGESRLLDRVADCLAFGALKPCKECQGQFVFSGNGYKCTGNISDWAKCLEFTLTPDRKAFKIPKEFHDVPFLKSYKYVKRDRVISKVAVASASTASSSLVSSAADDSRPLHGMRIAIIGKTGKAKEKLVKAIQDLGGLVVGKIDKTVAVCISSKAEVDKMKKGMQQAKDADVHVVDEEFIEKVQSGNTIELIKAHNLVSWGGDPKDRIGDVVDGPSKSTKSLKSEARVKKEEAMFAIKNAESKIRMQVKGGAAVDPDSNLEDKAHVLNIKGTVYNVVLGLVDIVHGTNSYYKLQILENDSGSGYHVFRAWGRVGTTIGGNKVEKFGSRDAALNHFKSLYLDKTNNNWEDRANFVKYPTKFYPLDIDYGQEEDTFKALGADAGLKSKLSQPVQDLVKMIFDVESMKKAMLEFEIDLKKMPLGKLSKKQIEQAFSVLSELNQLIDDKASQGHFLDASNRFYTLIPHDFGMKQPPLLDTRDVIKNKTEMLNNLLDIEVACSILKSSSEKKDGEQDILDVHYEKLKTDIQVLDKSCEEYETIDKYVKNTHAATHNYYDLEIEEVFKIDREGEKKRYKPFKQLHNRKLLWHGSRLTNYSGILSQGLRIAPPEAPVTGYMFGKGVYFADMVSKSANYCSANSSSPTGLLLLCEVALGNMYECTKATYVTKLPKGKHSTKGCGRTNPDPEEVLTLPDGTQVPYGKGIKSDVDVSSLLYNEFIVYDVAQINMKYLVQTKFKYKY